MNHALSWWCASDRYPGQFVKQHYGVRRFIAVYGLNALPACPHPDAGRWIAGPHLCGPYWENRAYFVKLHYGVRDSSKTRFYDTRRSDVRQVTRGRSGKRFHWQREVQHVTLFTTL